MACGNIKTCFIFVRITPPQIFTYNLDLLSSFCFLPYLPLLVITLLFSVVFWRHSSGPGMGRVIWYILISIGWRLILLMLKMTMITTISWGQDFCNCLTGVNFVDNNNQILHINKIFFYLYFDLTNLFQRLILVNKKLHVYRGQEQFDEA